MAFLSCGNGTSGGTSKVKTIATGNYKTYSTQPEDIIVVGYYGTRWVNFSGSYTTLMSAYHDIDGTFKCGTYVVKATGTSVTVGNAGASYFCQSAQYRYQ